LGVLDGIRDPMVLNDGKGLVSKKGRCRLEKG